MAVICIAIQPIEIWVTCRAGWQLEQGCGLHKWVRVLRVGILLDYGVPADKKGNFGEILCMAAQIVNLVEVQHPG